MTQQDEEVWIPPAACADLNLAAPSKQLRYEQYTVGWLCALPKEMTAAKAMLDEVHHSLPNPRGDLNAYQLGSMGRHNVVITCIRSGVYGTTSATAAAIMMCSTYPNCNITPLLVGIAGGVPAPESHDVRLGDVVISNPSPERPAVIQYDYGKKYEDEEFAIKGTLNKPAPAVLNALSRFQSDLRGTSERSSEYLHRALHQRGLSAHGFSCPGVGRDVLMTTTCEHFSINQACSKCLARPVVRSARDPPSIKIHYGSIASGNCVIKHGPTRDRIAKKLGILCFEMEAAGVMDYFPCLVVRGICDYCDAHKSKEWQEFAALNAAATARAFLDDVAFSKDSALVNAELQERATTRQALLESLDFMDSDIRRHNVRGGHTKTLRWALEQTQLQHWFAFDKFEHEKLLWIKGKPGAGKSTIMKFILDHIEHTYQSKENISIVSFFFNARGAELVRSTMGMYRALLGQILRQLPILQSLLDKQRNRIISDRLPSWTLESLEELFEDIVKGLGEMHLFLCIDALDECPEDQIRQMVGCFDRLVQLDTRNHLHVCFSSRHYPRISMERGLEFVLDTQTGHHQDIRHYLDSELVLNRDSLAKELREKTYVKSGGTFLWVVLVVRILKTAYDRGEVHRMAKLLDQIPSQVDEVFRDMLTRDMSNVPQLIATIRWVLYARVAMFPSELYYATLWTDPTFNFEEHRRCTSIDAETMWRYLLHCSKGIIERTDVGSSARVQFIHETVREFFVQPLALKQLSAGIEGFTAGADHSLLVQICYRSIQQAILRPDQKLSMGSDHFSLYAIHNLLWHCDQAVRAGHPQSGFMAAFDFNGWYGLYCKMSVHLLHLTTPLDPRTSSVWTPSHALTEDFLGLVLISSKLRYLFREWLSGICTHSDWNRMAYNLMLGCVMNDDLEAFEDIVRAGRALNSASGYSSSDVSAAFNLLLVLAREVVSNNYDHVNHGIRLTASVLSIDTVATNIELLNEALHVATNHLVAAAVELFLRYGADANAKTISGDTAIQKVMLVVRIGRRHLNQQSHEDQNSGDIYMLPRRMKQQNVSESPSTLCVKHLLYFGADVNAKNRYGDTALHFAVKCQCSDILNLLLDYGAHTEVPDRDGETPLLLAMEDGSEELIWTLVTRGASVDAKNPQGKSALHAALMLNHDRSGNADLARCVAMAKTGSISSSNDLKQDLQLPGYWPLRRSQALIKEMLRKSGEGNQR